MGGGGKKKGSEKPRVYMKQSAKVKALMAKQVQVRALYVFKLVRSSC